MLSVTALSEANLNWTHNGHRVLARIDDVHSACLCIVSAGDVAGRAAALVGYRRYLRVERLL